MIHAAPALVEINLVGEQAAPTTVFRSQGHTKLQFPSGEFQSFAFPCLQGSGPAWKGKNISGSIWELKKEEVDSKTFL